MTRFLAHARLLVLTAAIPFTLAIQSRAFGQEPALEVFYRKLDPKAEFKYKLKGKEVVRNAGVLHWEVPQTEFGTNGLDRNFTGYCAEINIPIMADRMYSFRVNSLFEPSNFAGLAGKEHDVAILAAQKRVIYIKELFGRYFRDPILKVVDADEALGLQVALWEILQETEPAEGQLKLDLFSGDFQANYRKADAPAYVLKAQEFLNSLTGNDALFYQNPDLRGRELIRLQGIPSPNKQLGNNEKNGNNEQNVNNIQQVNQQNDNNEQNVDNIQQVNQQNDNNVVPQSQFALRFAGGGGAGVGGPAGALLGGGLGGFGPGGGGGFGPGGGLAPFLGAGGGGAAAPGSSSPGSTAPGNGTTTPVTPVSTTPPTTPPITTPPLNGPPSGPPSGPPGSPVPAPAGLLLGAIAAGTLGAWRLGVRLLASK